MKKRLIENRIIELLNEFGGVLIYGAKSCGKTFIAELLSKSQYYMQDIGKKNLELISMGLESKILDGKNPRLIDEWQIVPEIWDKIRYIIDKSHGKNSLYLLTGSNTLYNKNDIFHSGAGRIARIKMNTLSYCEFHNINDISLKDLINNKQINLSSYKKDSNINDVIEYILHGGWPTILDKPTNNFSNQYVKSIINMNIDTSLRYKNEDALNVLKSLSRLNSSQIKKQTIISDINNSLNEATLDKYLDVFKNIYLLFNLNPWGSNIRSKYKMRTTPKTYLCDPSIGLSCLQINTKNQLLNDLNTLGLYFENLVIKDLSSFCEANNAEMFFYRNERGEEIDCIIQMPNGKWAAIEIKLTNDYKDMCTHVSKLNKVISQIEPKSGSIVPSLKLIITSHGYQYMIDDVYIIPYQLINLF